MTNARESAEPSGGIFAKKHSSFRTGQLIASPHGQPRLPYQEPRLD